MQDLCHMALAAVDGSPSQGTFSERAVKEQIKKSKVGTLSTSPAMCVAERRFQWMTYGNVCDWLDGIQTVRLIGVSPRQSPGLLLFFALAF